MVAFLSENDWHFNDINVNTHITNIKGGMNILNNNNNNHNNCDNHNNNPGFLPQNYCEKLASTLS